VDVTFPFVALMSDPSGAVIGSFSGASAPFYDPLVTTA
jgi:hypothetical protein